MRVSVRPGGPDGAASAATATDCLTDSPTWATLCWNGAVA